MIRIIEARKNLADYGVTKRGGNGYVVYYLDGKRQFTIQEIPNVEYLVDNILDGLDLKYKQLGYDDEYINYMCNREDTIKFFKRAFNKSNNIGFIENFYGINVTNEMYNFLSEIKLEDVGFYTDHHISGILVDLNTFDNKLMEFIRNSSMDYLDKEDWSNLKQVFINKMSRLYKTLVPNGYNGGTDSYFTEQISYIIQDIGIRARDVDTLRKYIKIKNMTLHIYTYGRKLEFIEIIRNNHTEKFDENQLSELFNFIINSME